MPNKFESVFAYMLNQYVAEDNLDGFESIFGIRPELYKAKLPPNAADETISSHAIDILEGRRTKGHLIYRDSKLFAIATLGKYYVVEFVNPINTRLWYEFNMWLESWNKRYRYYVWDIGYSPIFLNDSKAVEVVHLMETSINDLKVVQNAEIKRFDYNKDIFTNMYNDSYSFDSSYEPAFLKNYWFDTKDVYIVGKTKPDAFLVIRKRSDEYIEIYKFGITKDNQSKGISKEFFGYLMYLIKEDYSSPDITVQIFVDEDNIPAYRLYEKHNFKSIRIRKKYAIRLGN